MSTLLNKYWMLIISAFALFFGVVVSLPYVLHILDARYAGVPVQLNSDEALYLARTQQVLCCGVDQLGSAVAGGDLPSLQSGLIEQVYGVIFRPFVHRASTIFTVMDFIFPIVLFITVVGFARSAGMSREQALVIAVLFCVLELYNLGRPIHQRASFFLTVLSMWGVMQAIRSRWWGIATGVLLGLLVGVYFWSWTAAWCWWGVVLLYHGLNREWPIVKNISLIGVVGLLSAAPQLYNMMSASSLPNYQDAFFRSGIAKSHTPESWVWSSLFVVMAVGSLLYLRKKKGTPYIPLLVITACILLNQHIVHGTRFVFASHYLFVLVFAAVSLLIFFWKDRSWYAIGSAIAAAFFLAGIAVDGLHIIGQWRLDDNDFSEQHLASILPVLDGIDRSVLLSDPDTSLFVAAHTQHDVLYTVYIQHELRSHVEIAERYCLTQAPVEESARRYDEQSPLIYGAAYDALDHPLSKQELRYQEIALVTDTCKAVDGDLKTFLQEYHVRYVLHDKVRHPEWNMHILPAELQLLESTDAWDFYQLIDGGVSP